MKYFLLVLFLALPALAQSPESSVRLQFPGNPVTDVAMFYEALTKKRLIRDANLAGPNLTIVAPDKVSPDEAIRMIEASFLLNGYTLVPVDEHTSKLIGPTKQPRSEAVPLYSGAAALPAGDQLISYFMPFDHISSEEAMAIFNSYVALRPFGSMVPVPNANALVITENTPLILRLIALKNMIDVPGSRSLTEFFPLQRADAEKVAELLSELLNGESAAPKSSGGSSSAPAAPQTPKQPGNNIQVFADTRTNRILVVAPEKQMPYIKKLVSDLDISVAFEEPFERPLRFVAAADVFPVLANMLSDGLEKEISASEESAALGTKSLRTPGGLSGGTYSANGDYSQYGNSSSGINIGNSYSASGGTKPDRLRDPNESTAPLSIVVGHSRIIADRSSNKIIVIGPPESRTKASRVLDLLDRRPKQVYLATIIGQLTLGDGVEAGVDYLAQFGDINILGQGTSTGINNLMLSRAASLDVVPDPSQIASAAVNSAASAATSTLTNAATQALPVLSGLTVFGTIADSIDIYARALASTNKFEVISRPVVYTANNKRAVISSGQQVPVPESTMTSALGTTSNNVPSNSITSNIEYKDVVLKLEVIPLINSDNEVTLTIAQQNDNIQEQVEISNNQVPVIGTQELVTTVTVPNRHTIVLGGLITDQEQRIQTGIPFLKDIPGLGYLFGTTKKDVTRRELIVLIQPFIIDNEEKLMEANNIERSNTSFRDDLYDDKVPVRKALAPNTPRAEEQRKAEEKARKAAEQQRKAAAKAHQQ